MSYRMDQMDQMPGEMLEGMGGLSSLERCPKRILHADLVLLFQLIHMSMWEPIERT
jgi:hypothetical protein